MVVLSAHMPGFGLRCAIPLGRGLQASVVWLEGLRRLIRVYDLLLLSSDFRAVNPRYYTLVAFGVEGSATPGTCEDSRHQSTEILSRRTLYMVLCSLK